MNLFTENEHNFDNPGLISSAVLSVLGEMNDILYKILNRRYFER